MLRQKLNSRTTGRGAVLILFALLLGIASPAFGQLIQSQVGLLPERLTRGAGTVRLDGIGGFEISVADENNEITLWDYSLNPAGFGDDKDSWSLDVRYTHQEQAERDQLLTGGQDGKLNDGTFLLGYYSPGNMGFGGFIDYAEATRRDFSRTSNEFRVVGFALTGHKYLAKKLSLGLNLVFTDLERDSFSSQIYTISHEGDVFRGSLGLSYELVRGIGLGARGDVISTKIDGESRSSVHTDRFDWNRPGYLGSFHAFVDRGRVKGAFDYTRQELEGEEKVNISWSERFTFNPTPEPLAGEFATFSEDRSDEVIRTRWEWGIIPRRLAASAAYGSTNEKFTVVTNPNAIGSLTPDRVENSSRAFVAGLSLITFQSRLLLAGEVKSGSSETENLYAVPDLKNELDELVLRVGGEYLLGETLALRGGLVQSQTEMGFFARNATGVYDPIEIREENGELVDTKVNTTFLAMGVGLVPSGAILQFDLAYDVIINSDLNSDGSRFSAYLRYLF
jgi:hypothetical protein